MYTATHSHLSLQPHVVRERRQLVVYTAWPLRLLTAGGYLHRVHVDGDSRYIHFYERSFWFRVQTRVIAFREVECVRYEYRKMPTSFDRRGRAHDEVEWFRVGVQLRASEEVVPVATFFGEGATGDGGTLLLGDGWVDWQGTQERSSYQLVMHLCELAKVSLGRPYKPLADEHGRTWKCEGCGRHVAPTPRCLYCGGTASPS